MQYRDETIRQVSGQVHAISDRGILFSADGDQISAVILPLAHVEIGELHHGVGVVTMPAWLAADRGLA